MGKWVVIPALLAALFGGVGLGVGATLGSAEGYGRVGTALSAALTPTQ